MTPEAQLPAAGRLPIASRLWDRALDLLFPPRCAGCGAFGAFLCDPCLAVAAPAGPPRCSVCWAPRDGEGRGDPPEADKLVCYRCRRRRPAFHAARAAFVYEGPVREAVHAFKFNGLSALAPVMGALMAERLREWSPPVQAVVPVPLSGHRQRERGYNQSQLLAREISRQTGLPLAAKALRRARGGVPQVRQPDEEARRAGVAGAFAPGRPAVSGGILLVDDVITTGATLDACARVLLHAGAEAVFALTFARED
ncbi:MAG: ComF family protein [Dehalococcoidia bacterium]|nr:ComF family protein [Dehalococcoidia bacterium]